MKRTQKIKIYADENISRRTVKFLRDKLGWDVRYACEEKNLRGKEDLYHHRRARKEGRILLTRDKGYFNPYLFPLHRSMGIIVLEEKSLGKKSTHILSLLSRYLCRILAENPGYLLSTKLMVSSQGVKIISQKRGEDRGRGVEEKLCSWEKVGKFK